MGDLLIFEYIRDWFDEVVIGNHELPFFGGPGFTGLRSHDRELRRNLLQLEYEGKYVPSTVVDDYLLVHGGLSNRWGFQKADDANDIIRMMWSQSQEQTKEVPILDWIGPGRTGAKWADETGGIFWLDWSEDRNTNFNQIVGHSTITSGPVRASYKKKGTEHWNIDVGGKYGIGLGGVLVEQGKPTLPIFWGERVQLTEVWEIPTDNIDMSTADEAEWAAIDAAEAMEDGVDTEWIDLDDPENIELYRQLMEST